MEGLVEKRRYIWTIENFTRAECLQMQQRKNYIRSDSIEIELGDNETEWHFTFYPRRSANYFGFYARKVDVDDDNFTISLNVAVRTSDYKILPLRQSEKVAHFAPSAWGWPDFLEIESIFDDKNKYLLNDTLTLIIDIKLCQHDSSEAVQQHPLAGAGGYLFDSKKFSDITLICSDGKEFAAHRCTLDSRSSVFKTLLASDMFEKKSSKIVIADIDGDTMHEVLRFIYTNAVENLSELATKLIYTAEKYDLQDLKSMCGKKLATQITSETVFEFLVLADRYNEETLLEECIHFIDWNFEKLKASEDWKKIGIDLMMKCMQYGRKMFSSMISLNSSL